MMGPRTAGERVIGEKTRGERTMKVFERGTEAKVRGVLMKGERTISFLRSLNLSISERTWMLETSCYESLDGITLTSAQ